MNLSNRVVERFILVASVGTFTHPPDHMFGQEVPKGGSDCSKCRFIGKDGQHCGNTYYQQWRQSLGQEDPSVIPFPADRYCCDVFRQMV